jgi:hypothetical protein
MENRYLESVERNVILDLDAANIAPACLRRFPPARPDLNRLEIGNIATFIFVVRWQAAAFRAGSVPKNPLCAALRVFGSPTANPNDFNSSPSLSGIASIHHFISHGLLCKPSNAASAAR